MNKNKNLYNQSSLNPQRTSAMAGFWKGIQQESEWLRTNVLFTLEVKAYWYSKGNGACNEQ